MELELLALSVGLATVWTAVRLNLVLSMGETVYLQVALGVESSFAAFIRAHKELCAPFVFLFYMIFFFLPIFYLGIVTSLFSVAM